MADIFSIVAPLFIVIAIGFAAVRSGLFDAALVPGLGRFVLYFALPALIFLTLAGTDLGTAIVPGFLLAYGGGTLAAYGLMFAASRFALSNDASLAGVKSLGASFPNSAFVGYPLLLLAFDEPPIAAFAMALMFENVVLMPLSLIVLELAGREPSDGGPAALARAVAVRVATNPIIIAIVFGLAASVLDVSTPAPLNGALDLLGKASAGAALFFIGGSLAGRQLKGARADIAQIAGVKLVIHPMLVAGGVWMLPPFDADLQRAVVLIAACPMLAIYPVLSARFGHTQLAAGALVVATVAAFFTLSAVLAVL